MSRRIMNRQELRAQVEAAEARGLTSQPATSSRPRSEPERRPRPQAMPRIKVVWSVCDLGGRTVATFDYPAKAQAEALAADLKARGKGNHFVRSEKVPLNDDRD